MTLASWSDIWLNEGFATYAEWLWDDHAGTQALDDHVTQAMSQAGRWREAFGPVLQPSAPVLFSPNQYDGSALTLEALRRTVGDDIFFDILRTWVERKSGGTATTAEFEALAGELAGSDLTPLFDAWLRSSTLPSMPDRRR